MHTCVRPTAKAKRVTRGNLLVVEFRIVPTVASSTWLAGLAMAGRGSGFFSSAGRPGGQFFDFGKRKEREREKEWAPAREMNRIETCFDLLDDLIRI